MANVNKKIMECLLIVWMHINRGELSTGRTLPRRPQNRLRHFLRHGCLSRAFILSTPIPSEFTGPPITTSLEVSQNQKRKTSTSFVKVLPPKKTQTPRLSFSSNQKGPLPYVTGSYVTSLSNVVQSLGQDQIFHLPTVKFRHPPEFSLQRDSAVFTGDHASRRNEEPPEQGKKKRNTFHLPCFSSLGINKLSFHTIRNLRQLSHYLNKA
ncbi:hypothetical protein AVEN_210178-1 [Araneus ventricosus]|uniref:Uncharacterized protein n=1 Tax=Araneus ventricosus TaxID=182803 RepID=A0A4Y2GIU7_ARAVE|nr:hypothetical protein AVEN_210178-1 [Araneus ventricosus]